MTLNKNYFLVILLSLLLLSFSAGDKNKNDLQKNNLHGKIKLIHLYNYGLWDEKTFTINPHSISITDTNYDYESKYDKSGNETEWSWNRGRKSINIYDKSGNLILQTLYDKSGKPFLLDSFKYDINTNTNEHLSYCLNDSNQFILVLKSISKVDKYGNLIERNNHSNDTNFTRKIFFKYDLKGNNVENDTYNPDGKFIRKGLYKYDNKGNKTESYEYEDSSIPTYIYKYDEHDNVVEESHFFNTKKLMDYYTNKYEYDKKGNWIKKITYKDNKPFQAHIRVIGYY